MGVRRGGRRDTDNTSDGGGLAPFCPPSYVLEPLEEPKDLGQAPTQEDLQRAAEKRVRLDRKLTKAIAERKAQLTKVLQGCLDRVNEQLERGELPCTKAHFPAINPFDFEDLEELANHDFTVDLHADEVDQALRDFVGSILGIVWSNIRLENEGKATALRRFNEDLRGRMEILESCLQERSKQLSNCRFAYWQEITHLRNQVYFKEKEADNFEATLAYFFDPIEYLDADMREMLNAKIKQSVKAYQTRLDELTRRNEDLELQLESAGGRFNPMESDDMVRVLRFLYSKHGWKRIVDAMGNDMCKKEMLQWAKAQGLTAGTTEDVGDGGLGEALAEARAQSSAAWKQVEKLRQAIASSSSEKEEVERLLAETEERLEEKLRRDAGQEDQAWMAEEKRRSLTNELEAARRDLAKAKLAQERERARADQAEERADRARMEPRKTMEPTQTSRPSMQPRDSADSVSSERRGSALVKLQEAHLRMQQQESDRMKTRASLRRGEGNLLKKHVQQILGQGKLIKLLRARSKEGGAAQSSQSQTSPPALGSTSSSSSPRPQGQDGQEQADDREQTVQKEMELRQGHSSGENAVESDAHDMQQVLQADVQSKLAARLPLVGGGRLKLLRGSSAAGDDGSATWPVARGGSPTSPKKTFARPPLPGSPPGSPSAVGGGGVSSMHTAPAPLSPGVSDGDDAPPSGGGGGGVSPSSPRRAAPAPLSPSSRPAAPAPVSPGSRLAAPATPSGRGGGVFRLAAAATLSEGDDGSLGGLSGLSARGRGFVAVAAPALAEGGKGLGVSPRAPGERGGGVSARGEGGSGGHAISPGAPGEHGGGVSARAHTTPPVALGEGGSGGRVISPSRPGVHGGGVSARSHATPLHALGEGGSGGHATSRSVSGERVAPGVTSERSPPPASSSGGQAIWPSGHGDSADGAQGAAGSASAQSPSSVPHGGGHTPSLGVPGEGGGSGGEGAAGVRASAADAASERGTAIRGVAASGGAGPENPQAASLGPGVLGGPAEVATGVPAVAPVAAAMLGSAAASAPAAAPGHLSSSDQEPDPDLSPDDALQEDIDRVTDSLINALEQRSKELNDMEVEVFELRGLLEESSRIVAEVASPKPDPRNPDDVRAAMVGMARLANYTGAFYATGRQASKSFCQGPEEAERIRGRISRSATAEATDKEESAAISAIQASLCCIMGGDSSSSLALRRQGLERAQRTASHGSRGASPGGRGSPPAASASRGPSSRGGSPDGLSPAEALGLHVMNFGVREPPPREIEAIANELDDMMACARGSWDRALQYIRGQLPPPVGYGTGMCERVAFVRLLQGIRHRSARLDELVAMVDALKRSELEKLLEGANMLMESRLPDQEQEFRDLLFGRGLSSEALRRSSGAALQKLQRRWDRLAGRMVQALLRSSEEIELGVHPGRRAYVHQGQGGAAGGGLAARQMRDFSPAPAPSSDEERSGSDADGPVEEALRIHQLVPAVGAKAEPLVSRLRGQRGLLHDALAYCEGPVRRGALHEEGHADLAVDGQSALHAPAVVSVEVRSRRASATSPRSQQRTPSPKAPPATVFEADLTHEQDSNDAPASAQPGGSTPVDSRRVGLGKGPVEARGKKLLDDNAREALPRRPGAAPQAPSKRPTFAGLEAHLQAANLPPEEKVTLSQLLRTRSTGDMDEPQAEPAPADLDVTALLKTAKAARGADPCRGRGHARLARGGAAGAAGDGGPVPSWVLEQQEAGRCSRPAGGRHTVMRQAAGGGAAADPADDTLRRVASAGRLRARAATGVGAEAFDGTLAAKRVLPAVSRPGTR